VVYDAFFLLNVIRFFLFCFVFNLFLSLFNFNIYLILCIFFYNNSFRYKNSNIFFFNLLYLFNHTIFFFSLLIIVFKTNILLIKKKFNNLTFLVLESKITKQNYFFLFSFVIINEKQIYSKEFSGNPLTSVCSRTG